MKLIDGKATAAIIKKEIAKEVATMIDDDIRPPHLAAILVGKDPASETYVKNKKLACETCGFTSSVYNYPETVTEAELLKIINFLNEDEDVDGFIVQLPLPKHISTETIIQSINPKKDVDGFHPINLGRMTQGIPAYLPATPYGIVELLKHYKIETSGKNCVVIGRSNIVGTPMSILLSRNNEFANCTVTLCHSKTKNLKEVVKGADIIIAAIGKPLFVTADMVKDGAVIIDVGIHRVEMKGSESGFGLVGDVDFDNVAPKTSFITPVPGGVGPMTIVGLLKNTLLAAKKEIYS